MFLLYIIFVNLTWRLNGNPCIVQNDQINCTNFQNFAELDFSNIQQTINLISLKPTNPTLLDSDLDLSNINFTKNYIVQLENIKGFQFFSNPFANKNLIKGNLYLKNSFFDFYKDDERIDLATCDYINRNELYVSLFDVFNLVSLGENVIYPNEFCACEFKHVNIGVFEVFNLQPDNRLNFMKIPINDTFSDLNCSVNNLEIFNSELDLDISLVYPDVFRYLKFLFIQLSTITSIQDEFFKSFGVLKYFKLEIYNLKSLIHKGTGWMRHLNTNIKVNLSDQNDLYRDRDNQMILELKDLYKIYDFPDEDFCLFSNFPHDKLVFPIIETKKDLSCSCTLMWLIKNKNLYSGDTNILITKSVENCFNDPNFDKIISNCIFDKKIIACKDRKPSTSNYKILSIVFIVISLILLVSLIITLFIIFKYKKLDSNFSLGFSPQQA